MQLNQKEFELVKKTRAAINEVKKGSPLKDFMERDEIEEALELLINITKTATYK
jgi:hypothetical protein